MIPGRVDQTEPFDVFGDVSAACDFLARKDAGLAKAIAAIQKPVIRKRKAGFVGMFGIIVAQQLSVPSAQSIWARCVDGVRPMNAKRVYALGEDALHKLGLTRRKAHYVHGMAKLICERKYSFTKVSKMTDEEASAYLQQLKGIGPWSAGIYLLFCEGRINIWPPGDVALEHSYSHAVSAARKFSSEELNQQAEDWHPYRGLAAHILWTYYAHIKGRVPI